MPSDKESYIAQSRDYANAAYEWRHNPSDAALVYATLAQQQATLALVAAVAELTDGISIGPGCGVRVLQYD